MNNEIVNYFEGNPDVKIVGYIYETSNYDMFKKMEGNRDVERIGKLKASMQKNGFMNCPILINEKGEISDGQNRSESAKELGIPVKFVVQPGVGLEQVMDLNSGQKNWNNYNTLHGRGCLNNSLDCKRFEQLLNMFPKMGPRVVYAAMGMTITGNGVEKQMKEGTIVCTEEQYEEACKVLDWLSSFDDLIKENKMKGSKRNFHIAILFASRHECINKQVLSQRIRDNFHIYGHRFMDADIEVEKTESVYNYRVPKDNKVYIVGDYKKAVNSTSHNFGRGKVKNDDSEG